MKKRVISIIMFILSISLTMAGCGNSSSNSYSSKYSGSNYNSYEYDDDYGKGYNYDESDPYYSKNDHNHDGKITDEEFQDAMSDAIDDLYSKMY